MWQKEIRTKRVKAMRRYMIGLSVVTLAAAAAVTVGAGPARAALDCGFDFIPSTPTVMRPQIIGHGLAGCDTPPDTHQATITLEYQQGNRWVVASQRTDATIPRPYRAGGHAYDVSAACYAGQWREGIYIRGEIQGHTFQYEHQSATVDVPDTYCHPRF